MGALHLAFAMRVFAQIDVKHNDVIDGWSIVNQVGHVLRRECATIAQYIYPEKLPTGNLKPSPLIYQIGHIFT